MDNFTDLPDFTHNDICSFSVNNEKHALILCYFYKMMELAELTHEKNKVEKHELPPFFNENSRNMSPNMRILDSISRNIDKEVLERRIERIKQMIDNIAPFISNDYFYEDQELFNPQYIVDSNNIIYSCNLEPQNIHHDINLLMLSELLSNFSEKFNNLVSRIKKNHKDLHIFSDYIYSYHFNENNIIPFSSGTFGKCEIMNILNTEFDKNKTLNYDYFCFNDKVKLRNEKLFSYKKKKLFSHLRKET